MIKLDPWLSVTPTQIDLSSISCRKKIHQAGIQIFDQTSMGSNFTYQPFDGDEITHQARSYGTTKIAILHFKELDYFPA